jgi:hypothetical protein
MPLKAGLEEKYVGLLYEKLLGRKPEDGVLVKWVNYLKVVGPLAVVKAIARSAEAKHRAVAALYEEVLGRDGDPVGVLSWAQSKFTVEECREIFYASEEFLGSVLEEEPPVPPVPAPVPTVPPPPPL